MSSSRRQYPFHLIEPKWQQTWDEQQAFRAFNPGDEIPADHPFAHAPRTFGQSGRRASLPPKFYILDMFPYPSGAGLHVGHPEGYTATDILARYKRAQGFNVLHPMGWDAFGLPAEQYAVKTGQHPRKTTEANIANFTRQIKSLGFSYDWSRELATTDPDYFKWTQWIFLKLYNSWFNPETNKAEPIETLEISGRISEAEIEWRQLPSVARTGKDGYGILTQTELEYSRRAYRDSKRLAYVSEAPVNWWSANSARCWPTKKSLTARAKSAAFRSSASRCANGCSASPPTPRNCWPTSTRLTGAIRSRKCSGTGLAAAKARKWILHTVSRRSP